MNTGNDNPMNRDKLDEEDIDILNAKVVTDLIGGISSIKFPDRVYSFVEGIMANTVAFKFPTVVTRVCNKGEVFTYGDQSRFGKATNFESKIENFIQSVEYEALRNICFKCERLVTCKTCALG
ncbi:hypothetical protein Gotur_026987 [Gossypium turneri]